MGCCCSNDSDTENGIEKSDKYSSKNEESYVNPLMHDKEKTPTYGATSEKKSVKRYKEVDSDLSVDVESDSTTQRSDTDTTMYESQVKEDRPTSKKGKKKLKRVMKKMFNKKDVEKGRSQSVKTSREHLYEQSTKPSKRLTYHDITSIRETEKQKRANARAKDLEDKLKSKAVLDALQKAKERGEKLGKLQDTTEELRAHSEGFAETARRLAEREEQKYLGKKSKQQST